MPKRLDVIGHRYGRLVVLADALSPSGHRRRVLAQCDCGNTTTVTLKSLRSSNTTSCGCFATERRQARATHGATRGGKTASWYASWAHMVQRCTNPSNKDYGDYGGRGIRVCDRWLVASNFLADMGDHPPGGTIERVDNDSNYEPANCRWATRKEQGRNQRSNWVVTFQGEHMCFAEACDRAGVPYQRAYERVRKLRWPLSRALEVA